MIVRLIAVTMLLELYCFGDEVVLVLFVVVVDGGAFDAGVMLLVVLELMVLAYVDVGEWCSYLSLRSPASSM